MVPPPDTLCIICRYNIFIYIYICKHISHIYKMATPTRPVINRLLWFATAEDAKTLDREDKSLSWLKGVFAGKTMEKPW